MAQYVRQKIFVSATRLFAAELNTEFDTIRTSLNSVDGTQIAAGAVGPTALAANAVIASKILDGAVQTSKIQDNAVTEAKILDAAVKSAKIDDNAVTIAKILANSCTVLGQAGRTGVAADRVLDSPGVEVSVTLDESNPVLVIGVAQIPPWTPTVAAPGGRPFYDFGSVIEVDRDEDSIYETQLHQGYWSCDYYDDGTKWGGSACVVAACIDTTPDIIGPGEPGINAYNFRITGTPSPLKFEDYFVAAFALKR